MEYLPYAFLCYLTPIIAIIYAITGKFIWYEKNNVKKERMQNV